MFKNPLALLMLSAFTNKVKSAKENNRNWKRKSVWLVKCTLIMFVLRPNSYGHIDNTEDLNLKSQHYENMPMQYTDIF